MSLQGLVISTLTSATTLLDGLSQQTVSGVNATLQQLASTTLSQTQTLLNSLQQTAVGSTSAQLDGLVTNAVANATNLLSQLQTAVLNNATLSLTSALTSTLAAADSQLSQLQSAILANSTADLTNLASATLANVTDLLSNLQQSTLAGATTGLQVGDPCLWRYAFVCCHNCVQHASCLGCSFTDEASGLSANWVSADAAFTVEKLVFFSQVLPGAPGKLQKQLRFGHRQFDGQHTLLALALLYLITSLPTMDGAEI